MSDNHVSIETYSIDINKEYEALIAYYANNPIRLNQLIINTLGV